MILLDTCAPFTGRDLIERIRRDPEIADSRRALEDGAAERRPRHGRHGFTDPYTFW
jgi:hypothetical protein